MAFAGRYGYFRDELYMFAAILLAGLDGKTLVRVRGKAVEELRRRGLALLGAGNCALYRRDYGRAEELGRRAIDAAGLGDLLLEREQVAQSSRMPASTSTGKASV